MWLPAREHIRKPHLDLAYARSIQPVISLYSPQIAISLLYHARSYNARGPVFYQGCRDLRSSSQADKYFV